ncbi:MAG: class I SAM-dependent methyltransferase [Actinobacteria bacterium]|nr:class I SAM-dependent methyltransferase [Actinomycetota bacterium]
MSVPRERRDSADPPGSYDAIAGLYDAWSTSVVEDVQFYVEEAKRSGGLVVELGVGTGRIAVPIAKAGVEVLGIDSSEGMLAVAGRAAAEAGVADRVALHLGDLREPPIRGPVALVICPFRSLLHMQDDSERRRAFAAAHRLLGPGGRFVFDVFAPAQDDIDDTHGRWIEREPGIFERADWDTAGRTLTLSVRGPSGETTMALAWLSPIEWRMLLEQSGFEVEACYGWFDRRPYAGGEDTIWVARRPDGLGFHG